MPKFLKFCPYSDCEKECTPLESLVTLQIHNILSWDKDKNCSLRCDHQDTLIHQIIGIILQSEIVKYVKVHFFRSTNNLFGLQLSTGTKTSDGPRKVLLLK